MSFGVLRKAKRQWRDYKNLPIKTRMKTIATDDGKIVELSKRTQKVSCGIKKNKSKMKKTGIRVVVLRKLIKASKCNSYPMKGQDTISFKIRRKDRTFQRINILNLNVRILIVRNGLYLGDYNKIMKYKKYNDIKNLNSMFTFEFLKVTNKQPMIAHVLREWILHKMEVKLILPNIVKVMLAFGINSNILRHLKKYVENMIDRCGLTVRTPRNEIHSVFNRRLYKLFLDWGNALIKCYLTSMQVKNIRPIHHNYTMEVIKRFDERIGEFSKNTLFNTLCGYELIRHIKNVIPILNPTYFVPLNGGSVKKG